MKVLFLDIFCSIPLESPFWGRGEGLMMEIVHDGARVDSFLRGKFLGLVKINKFQKLRKYIFAIEIERIQFEQVKKKVKFVGIGKTISIKSGSGGINHLFVQFFDGKK